MEKSRAFIVDVIHQRTGIEREKIDCDANMFENDYLDSLSFFSLFTEIEVRFNSELSIEDIENLCTPTINNLVDLIENRC